MLFDLLGSAAPSTSAIWRSHAARVAEADGVDAAIGPIAAQVFIAIGLAVVEQPTPGSATSRYLYKSRGWRLMEPLAVHDAPAQMVSTTHWFDAVCSGMRMSSAKLPARDPHAIESHSARPPAPRAGRWWR